MVDPSEGPKQAVQGRLADWLPLVLVALGPLAVLGPILVRGEALYWGTPLLQFVPWRAFGFGLIRNGMAPLWNPLVGMGAPLLANHQSAFLYPPTWIEAVLPLGVGITVGVTLHLIFAAVGSAMFLRRLGVRPLGQVTGGLAFGAGSFLVTRSGFPSLVAAASWLPWMMLASDRLAQAAREGGRRWPREVGLTGMIVALTVLAGHAQTAVYTVLLAVAWSFWRLGRAGGRPVVRMLGLWGLSAVFGLGLSAAQWIPTAEYFLHSNRGAGLEETAALTYSFWPWRTLGLLLPGLFGSPATGDYWGYGNYWEDALYVGVLPLLMAIAGLLRASRLGREPGRTRWFHAGAGLAAFFLGLGSNNPVFTFLFRSLPPLAAFNAPTRINLVTVWALAVLAGLGADLWSRPKGRNLYWSRLGTAGAVAMAGIGLAAALAPVPLQPSLGRAFGLAGFWLAVSGAISLAWPERPDLRWVALIGLVVTADLAISHRGMVPSADSDLYRGRSQLAQRLGEDHRVYLSTGAERSLKFDKTHRFDSFQRELDPVWIRESGLPNALLLDGVPSADNFDPLVPQRYADWIQALNALPIDRREAWLRAMDVAWAAWEVTEDPPWVVYREAAAPGRARLVPGVIPVADARQALQTMASPVFDFADVATIEGAGAASGLQGGPGSAEILPGPDPGRVVLQVDAPNGGWVILSDTWYPGWEVWVDGAAAVGFPADGVFRGVWAPPGSRRVVWEFRPASAVAGAWVSILSVLGGAIAWVFNRRPFA